MLGRDTTLDLVHVVDPKLAARVLLSLVIVLIPEVREGVQVRAFQNEVVEASLNAAVPVSKVPRHWPIPMIATMRWILAENDL